MTMKDFMTGSGKCCAGVTRGTLTEEDYTHQQNSFTSKSGQVLQTFLT